MVKKFIFVMGLCVLALIVASAALWLWQNKPQSTDFSNSTGNVSGNLASEKANCTPKDGHAEGALTAQFDKSGNLTGWSCSMGGHMNCTAGPDGVWNSCDFPPDVMVWPPNVPKSALSNPKIYEYIPS